MLSFGIGRALGLSKRLAILVACGNSICGNSAIAAVAPVIGADGDDVASSIAFTAVLGVVVVLILPLLGAILHMTQLGYGALAGLTVYAVPQVIAAAAPMGAKSVQIGTLVKLIRVLMLGPVCLVLSLMTARLREAPDERGAACYGRRSTSAGTAGTAPARSVVHHRLHHHGRAPFGRRHPRRSALLQLVHAATILTVISMAALGLGVDVRTVSRAGVPVTITVILSLLALGTASFGLIWLLRL